MELKVLLLLFILFVAICIFLYPSLVVPVIVAAKYGGSSESLTDSRVPIDNVDPSGASNADPSGASNADSLGASNADPSFDMMKKPDTVIIPDKAKIFFDGNNLIHDYAGGKLKLNQFHEIADKLSGILQSSFPTQEINFIVKTTDKKKIIELSKKYPMIKYLFIKIKKTKGPHHMKASDDFTAALLGRNDYIVMRLNGLIFCHWLKSLKLSLLTI